MGDDMRFNERELRREVRSRVDQGLMPCGPAERVWAGPGSGALCTLCDRPITAPQIEYELIFGAAPVSVSIRFHRACQSAWELECGDT